jgi:hypothetical protein
MSLHILPWKLELASFFHGSTSDTHFLILPFESIACAFTYKATMSSNIADVLDNAAGKAQKAQGESLSTFLASLTTSGITLGLGAISYIFLKSRYPEL